MSIGTITCGGGLAVWVIPAIGLDRTVSARTLDAWVLTLAVAALGGWLAQRRRSGS